MIRISGSLFRIFLVSVLLPAAACARFKIQELNPVVLFSVQVAITGDENVPGERNQFPAERSGRVVYNFPVRPYFDSSFVYLGDPPRKLIRVFDTAGGQLEKMILSPKSPVPVPDGVDRIALDLNFPGWMAGDEEGNLYIQNYLQKRDAEANPVPPPENREPGALTTLSEPPEPSIIYQLNENSELIHTLYENPGERTPFAEILRLDAGENGRLFVLHAIVDEKTRRRHKLVSEYQNGILAARYLRKEWGSPDEQKEFFPDLEEMVSEADGRYVLACVAFRNKKTFRTEFRRIYRMERQAAPHPDARDEKAPLSPAGEMLVNQNPGDYFAWVRPDGGFTLMHPESDGSGVLYKIYDQSGEYINNQSVTFPGLRASWREAFLTHAGRVYSTRLYRGKFEIYEWQ